MTSKAGRGSFNVKQPGVATLEQRTDARVTSLHPYGRTNPLYSLMTARLSPRIGITSAWKFKYCCSELPTTQVPE